MCLEKKKKMSYHNIYIYVMHPYTNLTSLSNISKTEGDCLYIKKYLNVWLIQNKSRFYWSEQGTQGKRIWYFFFGGHWLFTQTPI